MPKVYQKRVTASKQSQVNPLRWRLYLDCMHTDWVTIGEKERVPKWHRCEVCKPSVGEDVA